MNFDYLNLYLFLHLLWFCLQCFNQCLKLYRTATGNTSSQLTATSSWEVEGCPPLPTTAHRCPGRILIESSRPALNLPRAQYAQYAQNAQCRVFPKMSQSCLNVFSELCQDCVKVVINFCQSCVKLVSWFSHFFSSKFINYTGGANKCCLMRTPHLVWCPGTRPRVHHHLIASQCSTD